MWIPYIEAKREVQHRNSDGVLTADRVYNVMYAIHEDADKADKIRADFLKHTSK